MALAGSLVASITAAHADCIDDAAVRHQVNPLVLRAIGWHESRLQPAALGHNADGSIDLGAFQRIRMAAIWLAYQAARAGVRE